MPQELIFHNKDFEEAVRDELLIKDRPVYTTDALNAIDLDLSEFSFDIEDCSTLCHFKNLEYLSVSIGFEDMSFFSKLTKLEELNIEYEQSTFDFRFLSNLNGLRELTVSGGDWSDMKLANIEEIAHIKSLEYLTLHEFGCVDLRPLKKMKQLKGFYCGYANRVSNVDAIGELIDLKGLTLIGLAIDNIDFFNYLPDNLVLDLCGIEFKSKVDLSILDRFKAKDVSEIIVNNERVPFECDYI